MSEEKITPGRWITNHLAFTLANDGYLKESSLQVSVMGEERFISALSDAVRDALRDAASWRNRADAHKVRDAASTFLLTIIASNTHSHAERIEAAALLLQVKP